MLSQWHEFYGLLGTAAAALVALLFVAASIGANVFTPESTGATRAFMSPVVFHYTNILFLSLIALVPGQSEMSFAITIGVAAFGSLVYSIMILVWVLRHSMADFADRLLWLRPAGHLFGGTGRGMASAQRLPVGPLCAGWRGAGAARGQHPQRLGPDAVAGAPERRKDQPTAVTVILRRFQVCFRVVRPRAR
jgi:hypothetical protein